MNTKPLNRNSQPRPQFPAPIPHLLPGTAQSQRAFCPRTRPSLPCPSVNSVVPHPEQSFSTTENTERHGKVSLPLVIRLFRPIRPFDLFGPLRPLPAISNLAPPDPSKLEKLCHKEVKNALKRSKMVTKTSKTAPNRSKSPRKRSRNSPVFATLTTHSRSIQDMSHARTTVYCIHLRPPPRHHDPRLPRSAKNPGTANAENRATEGAPDVGRPPIPARGLGCPFRAWLWAG